MKVTGILMGTDVFTMYTNDMTTLAGPIDNVLEKRGTIIIKNAERNGQRTNYQSNRGLASETLERNEQENETNGNRQRTGGLEEVRESDGTNKSDREKEHKLTNLRRDENGRWVKDE